ncbi:hypothetical protein [Variovorax sp. E3]|uniref:hypothetical protein n=1 Tax=Variovorax sp. E3 TaxID=1914993 RepID=UPI0018DE9277|nr:hypothetical protein [Variovorax sp. E3]
MAGTDEFLYHIDTITVAGAPLDFEDGTGSITGAARYENEVVPSGPKGRDYTKRKRVPTTFKCKLQFGPKTDPQSYTEIAGAQIAARDSKTGRRALMNNCSFASMGEIGTGSVDITFNVLSPIQWL